MDKPDVFMPLYIGDYLAGTSRLTTELHGAYMLLIMDYWMNGPLPDNDAVLASIAKMSPDAWSNARACLEHYFSIDEAQWKHKRIDAELEAAYEKKRIAKERAERAAAARWAKNGGNSKSESSSNAESNASSNAQEKLEECPSPSPSPSPSKNNKTLDFSVWPDMPSEQTLADWLAMRKRLKADVTQTVINRLANKLSAAVERGYTVDDCLAECVTRNWKGFDIEWMEKLRGLSNGHTPTAKELERQRLREATSGASRNDW